MVPTISIVVYLPTVVVNEPFVSVVAVCTRRASCKGLVRVGYPGFCTLVYSKGSVACCCLFGRFSIFLAVTMLKVVVYVVVCGGISLGGLRAFLLAAT